ncbi:hypothetical protein Pan216_44360 [Planctomycetes bacterium Pan216]|uniref:Uncharacterized protein n=1 Tax=Kolteria novifilia TaxID=2527975 RepID=A0A518B996_9BACT|nr:hypothetical protein Pan216_44360 [Planctomycetes bacterium Pan216]
MSSPKDSYSCSIDVTPAMSGESPLLPAPSQEMTDLLRELVSGQRELIKLNREQVQHARRTEERYQQQVKSQRQEFERWVGDNHTLVGRCHEARDTVCRLLGDTLGELVEFVDEHDENLFDSDYVRTDLVDRFGALLNHLSSMYGLLKKMAVVDQPPIEAEEPHERS